MEPQLAVLRVEPRVIGKQILAGRAGQLRVLDRLPDLVGVVVDSLPGAAGSAGLLRDVAVPATQAGGSVADPTKDG